MPAGPHARSLPGILFGVIVIIFALGNSWVGIYPFGDAVWIRPMLGLCGIIGAICLFRGNGWWRILLPLWCLLQTWVIATDVSREWFYQGLMLGWNTSNSVGNNQLLTAYDSNGVNFAGLILFANILAIAIFRLHPSVRRQISIKSLAMVFTPLLLIFGVVGLTHRSNASATLVLTLDLPNAPIYYKDKMLGRTPLRITPDLVREWDLPLDPGGQLNLYGSGWTDCVVLTDGATKISLYAGVPWPFARYTDMFDSPWGARARMHIGEEGGNRRWGYVVPKPAMRDEPILTIQMIDPQPIGPGFPLRLHCLLSNPTSTHFIGRKAIIQRLCFSYELRDLPRLIGPSPRRELPLPEAWNNVVPGANLSADITFDAPLNPGDYELFCTWFLYAPQKNSNTGAGGCYSNVLRIQVK